MSMRLAEQSATESAQSTVFLGHVLRTAALFGAVMGAAEGQEPVEKMQVTVRVNVPLLSHREFKIRQAAHQLLRDESNKMLDTLNPLPAVIHAGIDDKRPGLTPEQKHRLRWIIQEIRNRELTEPGRVSSPQENGQSMRDVLQEQFSLPIIAADTELETCIRTYNEGENGQTSMEALRNLCLYADCIPELSNTGIMLRRAPKGTEIRINNDLFHIIRPTENGLESTVFHAPDKAAILTVKTTVPSDTVSAIVEGTTFDWKTVEAQSTPVPDLKAPYAGSFEVMVGVLPEKKEILLEEGMNMTIGPQFLRIGQIEQHGDEIVIECNGTVYEDIAWPKTSCPQDMFMYQLAASTRFEGVNAQGKSLPLIAEDLSFTCRHFTFKIRSKEKLHSLRVRAFSDIIEKTLEMP